MGHRPLPSPSTAGTPARFRPTQLVARLAAAAPADVVDDVRHRAAVTVDRYACRRQAGMLDGHELADETVALTLLRGVCSDEQHATLLAALAERHRSDGCDHTVVLPL